MQGSGNIPVKIYETIRSSCHPAGGSKAWQASKLMSPRLVRGTADRTMMSALGRTQKSGPPRARPGLRRKADIQAAVTLVGFGARCRLMRRSKAIFFDHLVGAGRH